jgi:hypothetical protein
MAASRAKAGSWPGARFRFRFGARDRHGKVLIAVDIFRVAPGLFDVGVRSNKVPRRYS